MIVLIKSGVSPGKMAGDKDRRDKKNQMVYDAMVFFCYHFINKRERTFDQIVQAAQSGQQNIIEFSLASGTSKETEIKLPKEARGSLQQLLGRLPGFPPCPGNPQFGYGRQIHTPPTRTQPHTRSKLRNISGSHRA
jgi:hypothetical protein